LAARAKHVGVILWVIWKTLDDQLEPALAQFERWGVAGIKVDFMQRDDQALINFYHRVARETARRHMLVDFHGAIRAAILTRTWPNILSVEGVRGLEQLKWGRDSDPEHTVTLPFTRMLLGPMDYTPGAMHNATRATFAPVFVHPMGLGTRCNQLAMYVVFESPLQMLADSPSNYLAEPDAMEFIAPVPTVWDETRVLDGRIGDYVVVARRSGRDWYLGAMNDWTARVLTVDLDFLAADQPAGLSAAGAGQAIPTYDMTSWEDGFDAAANAQDVRKTTAVVAAGQTVPLTLAPGGGFVARLRPRSPASGAR